MCGALLAFHIGNSSSGIVVAPAWPVAVAVAVAVAEGLGLGLVKKTTEPQAEQHGI